MANVFGRILGFQFKKLEFELRYIKDSRGELIRIRIPRQDLFNFQNQIINSFAFKKLFNNKWSSDRFHDFIKKGLIIGGFYGVNAGIPLKDSVTRVLFIIEVVSWHMKKLGNPESQLFIEKRAWWNLYRNYALKLSISLKPLDPMVFSREFMVSVVRNYPRLLFLIKKIKIILTISWLKEVISHAIKEPQNSHYSDNPKIYVFGRGDVNLRNDGYHSDFFWMLNSDFPPGNILYEHQSPEERKKLEQYGFPIVNYNARISYKDYSSYLPLPIKTNLYKAEREILRRLAHSYNEQKNRWISFYQANRVKVHLTWAKYDHIHMAIADAIQEAGGVFAVWQMAFDGNVWAECQTCADLIFSHSNFSIKLETKLHSKYRYNIIIGYPKDYAGPLLKKEASILRNKLKEHGAKKIIFAIDENSLDDSRWHTGHELQRENYSFILEKVLEIPWLGVVFKPKSAKTLRRRLGDVNSVLEEAKTTGRCYVYDSSGRHTTSASPLLAGLSADVCIHGHLASGTAALECAIENIPTLLIDREGCPNSKFYDLPEGKVIFKDWPLAIDAAMEHFQSDTGIPGFGDWSSILDELDPFRDGKAAYRMGSYLHWVIQGFKEGLERDTILADAAERYARKWGADKVVASG